MAQTLGFDISFWQDNNSTPQMVDFYKAKTNGIRYVFIKASQANFLDQDFVMNWSSAKQAGLLRGAYHFLVWNVPVKTQADYFVSVLRSDPGELPPVLDFESRTNAPTKAVAARAAKEFMDIVERGLGKKPILYTSPGFWREFGGTEPYWRDYPLWIAHYTSAAAPTVPAPWTGFTFWQYTSHGDGRKYGTESLNVDLNWFNGTEQELYAFAGQTPGPEPTEPTLEEKVDILWKWYKENVATKA